MTYFRGNLSFNQFRTHLPNIFWGGLFLSLLILSKLVLPKSSGEGTPLYISPPKPIQYFMFGFKEQGADALWLRSIQDIDYCEKKVSATNCRGKSWLFNVFDVATDLSPEFRMVYAIGTLALSILVSDVEGASLLFDKAIKYFPNDWPMLYRAAYHALYETKDKNKAAQYLIRAGKAGAPEWVFSLAGRIYTDAGAIELAEQILLDLKRNNQAKEVIDRLEAKIENYKVGNRSPAKSSPQ